MRLRLNCLNVSSNKEMIPISKRIFLLRTTILAIFVIQSCSGYGANRGSLFAFTTTNYIHNSNNNGNKNGIITSGIQVDSYPVGISVNPNTGKIYVAIVL